MSSTYITHFAALFNRQNVILVTQSLVPAPYIMHVHVYVVVCHIFYVYAGYSKISIVYTMSLCDTETMHPHNKLLYVHGIGSVQDSDFAYSCTLTCK